MKLILQFVVLFVFTLTLNSSQYNSLNDNILSFFGDEKARKQSLRNADSRYEEPAHEYNQVTHSLINYANNDRESKEHRGHLKHSAPNRHDKTKDYLPNHRGFGSNQKNAYQDIAKNKKHKTSYFDNDRHKHDERYEYEDRFQSDGNTKINNFKKLENLNQIKKQIANHHSDSDVKNNYFYDRNVGDHRQKDNFETDARNAKGKAKILARGKAHEIVLNTDNVFKVANQKQYEKERYQMDPVLNLLRKNNEWYRRNAAKDESSSSDSSSRELQSWKDEWKDHWTMKKWEALNSTPPAGDMVFMAAARPWGVPCGDPNQHDMPWGTCMLPMECEPEFRIYRGDFSCGRTKHVCCGMQQTTYDLYQGLDVSFEGKGMSTEIDKDKDELVNDIRKRRDKARKAKNKRRRARASRKKKIRKNIKQIVKEIRKLLNRKYRNGTKERKKRTKQLKKFVKELKKQYKRDREAVKDVHEEYLMRIDTRLMVRLDEIRELNDNFMKVPEFRFMVLNGTMTKKAARMLVEHYPELKAFVPATRRSGNGADEKREVNERGGELDYIDYDVEY